MSSADGAERDARPFLLGLTGSMGMGKTTTAKLFARASVPVWSADAAVHALYAPGGAAVVPVLARWPAAADGEGGIDRVRLAALLAEETPGQGHKSPLAELEALVHPLVAEDRALFVAGLRSDLAVLDIPLLYESGVERELDAVLVVTAPPALQMARLRARPGYDAQKVAALLARQLPDREKRARADHLIETLSLPAAEAAVAALIAWLRSPLGRQAMSEHPPTVEPGPARG